MPFIILNFSDNAKTCQDLKELLQSLLNFIGTSQKNLNFW